ncbi:MAG: type II secretion system F family protein [Planctomycetaceae bacterium]
MEMFDLQQLRNLGELEVLALAFVSIVLIVGSIFFLIFRLRAGSNGADVDSTQYRREKTVFDEPKRPGLLGMIDQGFDRLILESGLDVSPSGAGLMVIAWSILTGGLVLVVFDNPLYAVATSVVSLVLVLFVLSIIRRRRMRKIREQIPNVADLLARGVRAGESLDQAIAMVGKESGGPLGSEFARCSRQLEMGRSMEAVMRTLTSRIRLIETRILASTLIVHRMTGGNLAIALERMASVIRDRINYQRQLRAATGAGRLSATIIAIINPLVFLLLFVWQPDHMQTLLEDSFGRMLLGMALVLEVVGIIWVLRILKSE